MSRFYFITGSAGSGKSTYIYKTLTKRAVEEPQKNFFLFVPEQNTLKAQQELIRYSEVHGMLNLDVLSLSLLGYRVMEELSIEAPEVLSEISRSLLMRKALYDAKKELSVYKNKTESPGFIKELSGILQEFSQYSVDTETLREISADVRTPLLSGKLRDISLILDNFYSLLRSDPGRTIPEELPKLLLKNLSCSHLLDGGVLMFDGFTGFTPLQLKLIEEISSKSSEIYFSVTIPESELTKKNGHFTDLFYLSRETINNVTDACTRARLKEGTPVICRDSAVFSGPLNLREGIDCKVYALPDPTEEIRFIAQDIDKKTRCGDMRFRRIAVAVSDMASYREIVNREFSEGGIPYFLDDNAQAEGEPVIELIRSAVLVIKNGYEYEDVMSFLKNPFACGEGEEDILCIFENYIRAAGIRGRKKLEQPVTEARYVPEAFIPFTGEMENFRLKRLAPMFTLHDSLKNARSASEKAEMLHTFIKSYFTADGVLTEEEKRFLNLSEELLLRSASLFKDVPMGLAEFSALIEAGLSDITAGTVPGTMDMVSVGDLKRSRFDDIDCLYIAGANEGLIPRTSFGGGLFTDAERMELTSKNLTLAPDDRHDASIQNFYLYLCMNKPAQELTVTYAVLDRKGKALKPSVILKDMKKETPQPGFGTGEAGALRRLSAELSGIREGTEPDKCTGTLLSLLLNSENAQTVKKAQSLLNAAAKDHVLERISPETAEKLYGKVLTGSVTRFEKFARCPFSHFLAYGLSLKERENNDIESFDIGRLYHEALDRLIKTLSANKKTLKDIPEKELLMLTEEISEEVCRDYNGNVMSQTARNRYIAKSVKRITAKTVSVMKAQAENEGFIQRGTEHSFKLMDDGFMLTGSIDRLDTLTKDGNTYVKIVDYKSGSAAFDLGRTINGLDLQLPAYMREALIEVEKEGTKAVPAGMFIYNIKDPVLKYNDDSNYRVFRLNGLINDDPEIVKMIDKSLSEDGACSLTIPVKIKDGVPKEDSAGSSALLSEELFMNVLRRNAQQMKETAGRIRNGDIAVYPYAEKDKEACTFCRYKAVCGFDAKTGYKMNRIPSYGKKAAVDILNG